MFGHITCLNGSVWLECNTDFAIVVHPEAELDGIANILQPWIEEKKLPIDTNDVLTATIVNARGKTLTVWDAFPEFFKEQSKTRDELIAAGLLAGPSIPV